MHDDAELLLNERHHSRGLGQPTGTNCTLKTLTRLSPSGPMAAHRDWRCPAPTGRWVPSWVLQIDPASRCSMQTRAKSGAPGAALLQRHRDHQVPGTALSGAERITSAASEPKATKEAPRAAWREGKPRGSESVQGSWFAGIDSVVSLPAPGPPTTWIGLRPLQAGVVAWCRALLRRPPEPGHR